MTKMDPSDRIDLTGHWAGFGFLGVDDPGSDAGTSNVVYMSRGRRPRQRV